MEALQSYYLINRREEEEESIRTSGVLINRAGPDGGMINFTLPVMFQLLFMQR